MNRQELKAKHIELNEKEAFTDKELIQYDKKDRSMIRNIQILNNFDKKSAIDVIKSYKGTPKANLRRMARRYRNRLNKSSGATKPEIKGRVKSKATPHKKKQTVKTGKILQNNRKETVHFLNNKTNKAKQPKTYARIQKASKKYIDASPYELRYGINSDKSQKYREKIGLTTKYEGRVIK